MAGVTSPSMPVFILQNKTFGNKSYVNMNEGLGQVLRMGAFGPEVIERLQWMEKVLYPTLKAGIDKAFAEQGGIDVKNIIDRGFTWATRCTTGTRRAPRSSSAPSSRT